MIFLLKIETEKFGQKHDLNTCMLKTRWVKVKVRSVWGYQARQSNFHDQIGVSNNWNFLIERHVFSFLPLKNKTFT